MNSSLRFVSVDDSNSVVVYRILPHKIDGMEIKVAVATIRSQDDEFIMINMMTDPPSEMAFSDFELAGMFCQAAFIRP